MKRRNTTAKSVAKILSPLILSIIVLSAVFIALRIFAKPALSAVSLFLTDGTEVKKYEGVRIFEGFDDTKPAADFVDGNTIQYPMRGDLYARLSIESCGIEDDLYYDDSNTALSRGLGQYYATKPPGFGKPLLIAGHNNHSFHTLGEAKEGDLITITTNYGIYQYKVTETKVMAAADFDEDQLYQDKEILILYTCYPFTTLTLTPDRFFVYAEKVSGPTVVY